MAHAQGSGTRGQTTTIIVLHNIVCKETYVANRLVSSRCAARSRIKIGSDGCEGDLRTPVISRLRLSISDYKKSNFRHHALTDLNKTDYDKETMGRLKMHSFLRKITDRDNLIKFILPTNSYVSRWVSINNRSIQ